MRIPAALALVLLLAACSGGGSKDPDLGSPDAPVPVGLVDGCPPREAPLRWGGGDLPVGAVGIRLCSGPPQLNRDGEVSELGIQAPYDELVTDVDEVVGVVNGLPEQQYPVDCPYDGGPDLVFWFRYADGDAQAVSYGSYGCHSLAVGGDRRRQRGEEVAAAFADALLMQRAATSAPTPVTDSPPCVPALSDPSSVLPQVPLTLVAARWCVGAKAGMRSAVVPGGLLARINASPLTLVPSLRKGCVPSPYGSTIQGITAWGDRVSLLMVGCGRVLVKAGFGREHLDDVHRFEDPGVEAALEELRLRPLKGTVR